MLAALLLAAAVGAGEAAPVVAEPVLDVASWTAYNDAIVELAMHREFDAARGRAVEALAFARERFGDDDRRTADAWSLLAEIDMNTERWAEAEKGLRAGMAIRERVLPPLDPDREQSYNLLSMALVELGRHDDAAAFAQRAVANAEKAAAAGMDGPRAPRWTDLVGSLNQLASVHVAAGRTSDAEATWGRTLEAIERYGKARPELQSAHLRGLFDSLFPPRYDALTERVARARIAANAGPARRDTLDHAEALLALAKVLQLQQREDERHRAIESAHAIAVKALPSDAQELADYLEALAEVREASDADDEAETLLRRALALLDAAGNAPGAASVADRLAGFYERTSRPKLGEPLRRRVLASHEATYGRPSWMASVAADELGANLEAQSRCREAIDAYAAAADAYPVEDRAESRYVRMLHAGTRNALCAGALDRAAASWSEVLALRVQLLGDDAPGTRMARRELAALRRIGGAESRATDEGPVSAREAAAAHATTIALRQIVDEAKARVAVAPKADPGVIATLLELGAELLHVEGQDAHAASEYEKTLSIRIEAQGSKHAAAKATATRLAALYTALGREDAAKDTRRRAGM
ncbi:MAG TPA: tetratricopeptide repeat protein [Candidatus Saccharimonadia bacterium]|nr:tetratricopeptide repeat protein [Candidatus Saccharimonadia bacterium]